MAAGRLRVDKKRLWQGLEDMAKKGALPGGGVSRLALTEADREGRDLLCRWLGEMGLEVKVDEAGNIVTLWGGEVGEKAVLIGSHLDTVNEGGLFDGAAGVMAGLEVLRTAIENGLRTRHPLGLVSFTNEEGARFTTDMMGSQAFCGELSLKVLRALKGVDGSTAGDELVRIGYAGKLPCGSITPHAYMEMHVEQGPVLDREKIAIGVVEAITGITWLEVHLEGCANHAGTTPMNERRDAGLAAARIAAMLPELAAELPDQRMTCGCLSLAPGVVNVIPGKAVFTVDLRNGDAQRLQEAEARLCTRIEETAKALGVKAEVGRLGHVPPQECDPDIVDRIEAAARALGSTSRRMVSGAGHDAQIMARICPAGMIFIPSKGGLSHCPQEYSSPEDLERGANVLLETVLQLAEMN